MHTYEIIFIIQPDLDETAITGIVDKVSGWITDAKGTIAKVERWGKRHMAYTIRKQREGYYVYVNAQLAAASMAELDRNLRFTETILRYLITNAD